MLESLATTSVHRWLTHARFSEKIAQFGISRFYVIIGQYQSQMIIEIVEFTSYESFSAI